jgi:hypothetical protein
MVAHVGGTGLKTGGKMEVRIGVEMSAKACFILSGLVVKVERGTSRATQLDPTTTTGI